MYDIYLKWEFIALQMKYTKWRFLSNTTQVFIVFELYTFVTNQINNLANI